MPAKKIEYHLEAYFQSLKEEPFASFQSVAAFPTFSVGDWIDARHFGTEIDRESSYKVKSVGHIMWETDNHIGHKLLLLLDAIPLVDPAVEWVSNVTFEPAATRKRDKPSAKRK